MNNATSKSQLAQRAGTSGTLSPECHIICFLCQPDPREGWRTWAPDGYLYPGVLNKTSKWCHHPLIRNVHICYTFIMYCNIRICTCQLQVDAGVTAKEKGGEAGQVNHFLQ